MDEFKYSIYCLHKSTHAGCVYSLKHHNKLKQPFIFVDEAVWRYKASSRLGSPRLLEKGAGLGWAVVAAGSLCPCSGVAFWVLGLSTSCSPPVLGGLSAASSLQELLQDEASCYSLSQIISCQHHKEVLLQAVSFCPAQGRLLHGMDKSPRERKVAAFLGWVMCMGCTKAHGKGKWQRFWAGLMCCQLPAWSSG